jgi:hypothetical protein
MKVTLPYLVVLVCRSENEKTPITVLPHEIEILKVLHGGDIRETDADPVVKESTFETEDEYARLQQYYKGNQEVSDPVRQALGTLKDFEESFEAVGNSDEKTSLLEEALSLGIEAKKTWGIAKLQAAIAEAKG